MLDSRGPLRRGRMPGEQWNRSAAIALFGSIQGREELEKAARIPTRAQLVIEAEQVRLGLILAAELQLGQHRYGASELQNDFFNHAILFVQVVQHRLEHSLRLKCEQQLVDRVPPYYVAYLVSQRGCQFIFTGHQSEHAAIDIDC